MRNLPLSLGSILFTFLFSFRIPNETNNWFQNLSISIFRFFEIKTIQHFVGHCDNPQSNDDQMEVNTTKPGYYPTDLRMNNIYINVYITWMYLVFMYIIPFSTLAVFNILTYLEIRRALARRAQLSG